MPMRFVSSFWRQRTLRLTRRSALADEHERRPQGRGRIVLSDPSRKALKSAGQLLADLPY